MWSPLGGKQQLFQTAQEQQLTARTDVQRLQQERGQDPACSALHLPLALSCRQTTADRAELSQLDPGQDKKVNTLILTGTATVY